MTVAGPRPRSRAFVLLTALGMFAASVMVVNTNLLVARFYRRWDLTSSELYSLSSVTREVLNGVKEPLRILVLLGRNDPTSAGVRHLLAAYRAQNALLSLEWIDPDRNPGEFLALQQRYQILAGKAEDGRLVTDASLILAQGDRHWFITNEEMVRVDNETGNSSPELEQALTEGIAKLLDREKTQLCFSTGHQELSLEDAGPEGLMDLRHRLEKNNYDVTSLDLSLPNPRLSDCRVLLLAAPALEFARGTAQHLLAYLRAGGNLLLSVGPLPGEGRNIRPSGLEPIAELAGVEFGRNLVLETESSLRLPQAAGEIFLARPRAHAITQSLILKKAQQEYRVLLSETQSLRLTSNSLAQPLLTSSPRARALRNLNALLSPEDRDANLRDSPEQAHTLAVAAELPKTRPDLEHGPRLVIFGTKNLLGSRNFRDPALYGNRLFLENSLSWLAARPRLVSIPQKPGQKLLLNLTEESFGEVLRYVVVYMPLAATLLGAFVLLRRRSIERRSRQGAS